MKTIVHDVASLYDVTPDHLTAIVKGPQKGNDARKIAMYLCQELAGVQLKDIAAFFNLNHMGSVSFITHQVRKRKREDHVFAAQINEMVKYIIKQAT